MFEGPQGARHANRSRMKRMGRLILGTAALIALLVGFYCLKVGRGVPAEPPTAREPRLGRDASPYLAAKEWNASAPTGRTNSAVIDFGSWTKKYQEAVTAAEKEALLAEGEELAKARLVEMLELIRTNPKQAIERAVSYEDRKRLPQSIVSLLEEPVSGKGDYYVLAARSIPGEPNPSKPVRRNASINGKTYDAYVYGRRLHQVTRENDCVRTRADRGDLFGVRR